MKAWGVVALAVVAVAFSGCANTATTSTEEQPAAKAPPTTETTPPPEPAPSPSPPEETPEPEEAPKAESPPPEAESTPEPEKGSEPEGKGGFCSSHACIPNFENGRGYPVECSDGEWSKSGGISGACSGHGGESGKP
jgi:hypothetical protein